MTKQEFEILSKNEVTDDEFKIINEVYTHHPCIDNVQGKSQVVRLYNEFGIQLFYDMRRTAQRAVDLENKALCARLEAEEWERQLSLMRPHKRG